MTGLGLRYCPQHPAEPLMMASGRHGVYWRCEHPSGCAHTESTVKLSTKNSTVLAVNGKPVRNGGYKSGKNGKRDNGEDSSVEKSVERMFKSRARRREAKAES